MTLSIRPNQLCLFCLRPISDYKKTNITWRIYRDEGKPFLALVHSGCECARLWPSVAGSNLSHVLQDPEDWRRITISLIGENKITQGEAEKELKMIFATIPEGFFVD